MSDSSLKCEVSLYSGARPGETLTVSNNLIPSTDYQSLLRLHLCNTLVVSRLADWKKPALRAYSLLD